MRLQDIAIVTDTPLDTDVVLLEKFKAHDRIHWDPRTDLYSYKVSSTVLVHHPYSHTFSMTSTSGPKPIFSPKFGVRPTEVVVSLYGH